MGSHMVSMASAEEGTEILFILCPGGGLFNATCTTGGWVPSLPQPPHECNDTVTSRFLERETATEANNSTNGSFVCFAVTCIRCAPVIFSLSNTYSTSYQQQCSNRKWYVSRCIRRQWLDPNNSQFVAA